MSARLPEIKAFCLTYELGNFTSAARALGVTPQAASRAVAKLERRLGVALFRRNTRHVEATESGRTYYEACKHALDTLDGAEARLLGQHDEPVGDVRVSVPTTYGHHRFIALMPEFRRRYARVNVDVEISNHNVDFVREGFDVAIRMGELHDASFVARRLGDFPLGVFASPEYLRQHGAPSSPEDVADHACGVFSMPRTGRPLPWTFDPGPEALLPPAALRVRHDILGLIGFAVAGGGLIQLYHFLIERELEQGQLVQVLRDYAGRSRPFSLIYPREAAERPAVRALVDFIVEMTRSDRANTGPGA